MSAGTISRSTAAAVLGGAGTPGLISRGTVAVVFNPLLGADRPGFVSRSTAAVVLSTFAKKGLISRSTVSVVLLDQSYTATITAECDASPSPGVEYEWEWRDDEAAEPAWEALGSTASPSIEIPDAETGHDYSVRVRAVFTSTGAFSDWVSGSLTTEAP